MGWIEEGLWQWSIEETLEGSWVWEGGFEVPKPKLVIWIKMGMVVMPLLMSLLRFKLTWELLMTWCKLALDEGGFLYMIVDDFGFECWVMKEEGKFWMMDIHREEKIVLNWFGECGWMLWGEKGYYEKIRVTHYITKEHLTWTNSFMSLEEVWDKFD